MLELFQLLQKVFLLLLELSAVQKLFAASVGAISASAEAAAASAVAVFCVFS